MNMLFIIETFFVFITRSLLVNKTVHLYTWPRKFVVFIFQKQMYLYFYAGAINIYMNFINLGFFVFRVTIKL